MIKNMLVAIDGSDHAQRAVDTACEIASGVGANLTVLYVIRPQELPKGLRDYAELEHIGGSNMDILKSIAGGMVEEAREHAKMKGVANVTAEVETGPVARTIVARAKHHNSDMIVIGSRGMGNIEATLRGGVSHRVELLSKCAVLTVK